MKTTPVGPLYMATQGALLALAPTRQQAQAELYKQLYRARKAGMTRIHDTTTQEH